MQTEKIDQLALSKLPDGVNWEDSPLFDFGRSPQLSKFPDLIRLLVAGHLAIKYSQVDRLPKSVDILDIAAGFGEINCILQKARRAKGAHLRYVGIDIDPRKAKRAKEIMPKIDYRLGMLQDMKSVVGDEKFDIVLSSETLEHVSKEDGIQFLKDCMSVLKQDGHLILTTALPSAHRHNCWHIYEWQKGELLDHLSASGYNVLDHFPLKGTVRDIPITVRNKLNKRVPNELMRGLLSPMLDDGGQICVVIKNGQT